MFQEKAINLYIKQESRKVSRKAKRVEKPLHEARIKKSIEKG